MVDSGPENGVAARGTAGLDESTHPGHAACAGPSDAPPGSPAPRAESSALAKSATNGFVVDMTCDSDAEEAARETGETIIVLDSDEETPSGLGRGDVSADLILDRAVDEAPRDARKVGPSQNTQTLIQRRGRGLKRTKRRIDEGPRKKNMSDIEMMSRTDPRISAPGESGPGHACPDTSPATSIEARDTGHDAVSAVARDARTAGAARRDAPAEKPDRSEPSCSPLLSLTSEDEARPNDRSGRGTGSGMGSKEKGRTSAGEGSGEGGQGSKKGPTLVGGGSGAVGQGSDSAEDSEIDEIELDDEDSDDSGPEEVRRGEACVLCGVSAGGKGVTIQGSSGAEEGGVEFVFEDDVVEFAENAKDALHAHVVCTLMGRDTCQRTCMRARDAAQAWWASAMTGGDGDRAVRREHVGQMRQDTWPGKKCHFCQKKGAGAEKPLPHCKCPVESCDVYGHAPCFIAAAIAGAAGMRLTHDSRDPTRPILPVFFCQKHFVAAAVDVSVPTVFLRAPTMRFLDAIRDSDDKVHAIEFPESVKSVRQLRGRRRGGAASVSRPEAPPSSSDLCESTDRNSAPSSGSARASSGEASSRQEGGKSEGGAAALHPLEPDPEAWPLERRVPSRSIFAARSSGRDGARRERGGGGTSLGCVVEETGGGRTRVSVRFGNPAPLIAAAGVLQKTMFGAAAPEDLLPDFEKGVDSTLFCGRDGTPLCSASDYCWGVPGYVLVLRKTQERLRAADQGQISFYGGVDGPGRERIVSMRWHTLAVHSAFFLESMRAVLSSEAWATHDAGSGTRNHISGTLTEARKAGVWKPSKSVDDMVTSARRLCEIVETLGGAVGWWLLRLSSSVEMVAPLIVPFSNGRDKDADLEVCMAGESNNGSVSGASVLKGMVAGVERSSLTGGQRASCDYTQKRAKSMENKMLHKSHSMVACMTVMSMRLSPTRLHANAITTARWLLSHLTSPDNAKKSLNVLKPPDNHTLESGFYRHSVPLSKIDYVPTGASGDFMRPGAKTKGFLSETEESCLFVAYKMVLSLASYLLSPCKEADVVSAASALLRHYVQKLIHVDKLPGVLKAATRRTEDHLPPEPWRVRHPSQCFPLPEYLPARRVLKWGSEVVDPAKGTLCAERADRAVPMLEIDWVKNHFKEFKDGQDPRRLVDDAWDKELGLYITAYARSKGIPEKDTVLSPYVSLMLSDTPHEFESLSKLTRAVVAREVLHNRRDELNNDTIQALKRVMEAGASSGSQHDRDMLQGLQELLTSLHMEALQSKATAVAKQLNTYGHTMNPVPHHPSSAVGTSSNPGSGVECSAGAFLAPVHFMNDPTVPVDRGSRFVSQRHIPVGLDRYADIEPLLVYGCPYPFVVAIKDRPKEVLYFYGEGYWENAKLEKEEQDMRHALCRVVEGMSML